MKRTIYSGLNTKCLILTATIVEDHSYNEYTAQDYGMSGKALNKKLSELGIQYSINGQWILYAKYKDCGYVSSRSIDIVRANGMPDVVLHTEWTQAGRKFLYEELKKAGIIPMLERS